MNNSITQFMNSLKNGLVEPVYVFQGTDKYLQKYLSDKIAEKFFQDLKYDKTILIPDDMKGEQIIEQMTATDNDHGCPYYKLSTTAKLQLNSTLLMFLEDEDMSRRVLSW